jgi:hypothetical protein
MVLRFAIRQAEAVFVHDLLRVLAWGLADPANVPMVLGPNPWACIICHRNNHSGMDLQMTNDQFIVAQKHRKYWDQYVASLTMRLPPDAVGELQAILTAHGRPPTNWWCADCVKSALQYIYLQADLFIEVNQNTVTIPLSNAPANPEQ